MFARCKQGTMRVSIEGKEYTLTTAWLEVPKALAENIAPHVNVEVSETMDPAPEESKAEPVAAPSTVEGPHEESGEKPSSSGFRRSGPAKSERKSG